MTFVVYVDDASIVDEARARAQALIEKHPARLVMVDASSSSATPEALQSSTHAQIVPDVPTVLFWAGKESVRDPNFFPLNELADILVLDSSRGSGDIASLRHLIDYFSQGRRSKVQDLAYLRLAPWQEMIATFFDDAELAPDLGKIDAVEIIAGSPAEQYYLLGWLASRLNWKPGSVRVTLTAKGEPRRVYDIALKSPDSTYRAALEEPSGPVVCLTVEGEHARERHCETVHDVSIVALVEQAILRPGTSDVYRATLDAARAFLDSTAG
jgi:glucose-6-phosphate dehydrogenase assembly protein OpcA